MRRIKSRRHDFASRSMTPPLIPARMKNTLQSGGDTPPPPPHHQYLSHESSDQSRKKRRKDGSLTPERLNSDSLDPDRAFRESLFDALCDDEGAEYWQRVYGQPIHTYPNTIRNEDTGRLEHMDDEEYAQYVRRKMWEKSREGIEEAREQRRQQERREKERKRTEREQQQQHRTTTGEAHNNWTFDFEIEASLQRGRRRRHDKRWQRLWADYLQKWQDLRSLADNNRDQDNEKLPTKLDLGDQIAWPVESGKRQDINPDKIEAFFTKAVNSLDRDQDQDPDPDRNQNRSYLLHTILKQERVLWHPDKMQQRYGFMQIDEPTMQGITATFQVLDKMWNDAKRKA